MISSVIAIVIFLIYNYNLCSGQNCSTNPLAETCDIVMVPTNKCTTFDEVYPDPMNCRGYFSCPNTPGALKCQQYECPNGFIYNSWIKSCELEPENVTDICEGRRADCRNREILTSPTYGMYYVTFPFHPAYYACCFLFPRLINDTAVGVLYDIYKCKYEYLQEMIVAKDTTFGCRFACREKGFFQNPGNCNQYVYCTGSKAIPTVMSCAANYVYDGTQCTTDKTKCKYP